MKHKKIIFALAVALVLVFTFVLAACAPQQVTVTLVFDNGSDNTELKLEVGEKLSVQQPTKEGYDFGGWYKDASCSDGQEWNVESDTVSVDITLYAKWTEKDPTMRDDIITVAKALELCGALEANAESTERYYIRGTIQITNEQYGQVDLTDDTGTIMVYGLYSADGSVKWSALENKPKNGDTILISANLKNYKGTTLEVLQGWIIAVKAATKEPVELPPDGSTLTVTEAVALADKLEDGETTTQRYFIRAKVKSIDNPAYGAMTITDGTSEIYVYGSYDKTGNVGYAQMEEKPYKGDEVYVSTLIQKFKGNPECKSTWIQEVVKGSDEFVEADYTEMKIDAARTAAEDAKVKVSGVVARITFATGNIPSGFVLVDDTGSIYVYDDQIAARVAIGNTVTIFGEKTWWILDKEQDAASKFGYKGCCQLENVHLKSNDGNTSDFDVSWVEASTVKKIMDTPVSTDITSKLFKVNALITKAPAAGYTNYYINDIDGQTGTYTYTQCNGGDFEWLDEFDGKICTVYLMALNAKSTATGCTWRFLPVKVIDENYTFNKDDAGEFAVVYFGVDQFLDKYMADPALELITNVDSELLKFSGAKLSYASSNTEVAYVDANNVFHTKNSGEATITITGKLEGYKSFSKEVKITVQNTDDIQSLTVAEAIAAAPVGQDSSETITVRGIVGPSLVNQAGGFYLIDETGVIAVKFKTASDISNVSIGDEIILTGRRDAYNAKPESNLPGETCITNATIVANLYGKHSYSTQSFNTTTTIAQILELAKDATVDQSAKVFKAELKIVKSGTAQSAGYYIADPADESTKVRLYCSSAAQYSWLEEYVGQTVTVEVALCNWNHKSSYQACMLAVYNSDGSKTVNELNFSK